LARVARQTACRKSIQDRALYPIGAYFSAVGGWSPRRKPICFDQTLLRDFVVTAHRIAVFALFTALLGLALPALASDILKERRWAEQISDGLLVGEAVNLTSGKDSGKDSFLALYTPAGGSERRGGVLLLHGLGAHPDWPDVIAPLRQELPDAGWATLSLQLPILPNDAKFKEYLPLFPAADARISAGIRYLQQQGVTTIALVGHSLGAAMGAHFLASKAPGSEGVRAFVGIGMNAHPGSVAHTPDALAKITVPVLDLYGTQDLLGVLASAKARARAARQANNSAYRQVEIPGADHFFRHLEDTLVKRVASWLTHTTAETSSSASTSTVP
jgi:pimeloyl-ACP methyl ester carboxylesterase